MLHNLPALVKAAVAICLLTLNTLFWVPVLLLVALIKLLMPWQSMRLLVDPLLIRIAERWISGNSGWMRLTQRLDWDVQGLEALRRQDWYLVISNHQSWVDIFVLQHVLNRRIPMLKFFLKKELIWVPVMGLAWWALDFPFMRRYTSAYLAKHPEARGKDIAATRAACEKFALVPTSVMNFVEGTRLTERKRRHQASPYRHLLRPKVGGITLALQAMGERFSAVIDVTIAYPQGQPSFWDFLQGRVRQVIVQLQVLPVPQVQQSQEPDSAQALRQVCEAWLNHRWQLKDQALESLLKPKNRDVKAGPSAS